jgi:hypothetical protein
LPGPIDFEAGSHRIWIDTEEMESQRRRWKAEEEMESWYIRSFNLKDYCYYIDISSFVSLHQVENKALHGREKIMGLLICSTGLLLYQ